MSYCFVCLFRADKSTSGLALRIPALWKSLVEQGENVYIVINQSLYNKTLKDTPKSILRNAYIIPDSIGFKASCLIHAPPLLAYLLLIKNISKFHLSVGGAYFIDYLKKLSNIFSKNITIHTSIGSKNLDMIVDGDKNSRYYKLHINLMKKSDKIDCLYSPEGFPQFKYKCIQSPGSFSWKYNTSYIQSLKLSSYKSNDIVFCGSLIPQKNYRLAIDSYKKLLTDSRFKKYNKNIPDLIIIAPTVPNELRYEIDKFNKISVGKIIFEDYKNIDRALKEGYIFLSLQKYDNYPSQSLIEAMAFGCTIIATNTGETSRIVNEDFGNILISNDTDDLVKAIINLLNQPNTPNLSNIDFILKNHTIESYSKYFLENFIN